MPASHSGSRGFHRSKRDAEVTGTPVPVLLRAVAVEPRDGYRIWLRCADGAESEVDLSDLAGKGVFAAWLEPEFCDHVYISEWSSIAWNNEIELCPDALYLEFAGKTTDDDSFRPHTGGSGAEPPSLTPGTPVRRPSSEAEVSWFCGTTGCLDKVDDGPARLSARYGEHRAEVSLASLGVLARGLPPTAYGLVVEWAAIPRAELLEAWEQARRSARPDHAARLKPRGHSGLTR